MRSTSSYYYHLCILIILSVTFVSASQPKNAVIGFHIPRGIQITLLSGQVLKVCDKLQDPFIDIFHIPTINKLAVMTDISFAIVDPSTCETIQSTEGTIPFFSAGGFFDDTTQTTYVMNEDSISSYDVEEGSFKFHCSLSGISARAGIVVNNILYIGDDNRTFHEISGFQNQDCSITASSEQITSNIPGTPDNRFAVNAMTALDNRTILVEANFGFRRLSIPDMTITVTELPIPPGDRVLASMFFFDGVGDVLATGRSDFGFDIRPVFDLDTVVAGCTNTALLEPAKAMSFSPQLRSVMYLTDKSLFAVNAFNCEIVKSCDIPSNIDAVMVDEQTGDVFATAENRMALDVDMDTCSFKAKPCRLRLTKNFGALRDGRLFFGSGSGVRRINGFTEGQCEQSTSSIILECNIQDLTYCTDDALAYTCNDGRVHKIDIASRVSTLLGTVGNTGLAIAGFLFNPEI